MQAPKMLTTSWLRDLSIAADRIGDDRAALRTLTVAFTKARDAQRARRDGAS